MADLDLHMFTAAVRGRAPGWDRSGLQWEFTLGPERDKSAAWLICETTDMLGQLTVWSSGEAELDIASLASGAIDCVRLDATTAEDIAVCLDELLSRLRYRGA